MNNQQQKNKQKQTGVTRTVSVLYVRITFEFSGIKNSNTLSGLSIKMAAKEGEKETVQSLEIDAAPSVGYINLPLLDIGSECTVVTEPKPRSESNSEEGDGGTEPSAKIYDETSSTEEAADTKEQEADKNLEVSVGSLNLKDSFTPEVTEDVDVVTQLLNQDSDGDTLLHVAVLLALENIAKSLIKLMVELDLPLDIPNRLHQTPLHLAVLSGLRSIVKELLLAGVSPFARDHNLRTAPFIACEREDLQMLDELLQNVNLQTRDHCTTSKWLNPDIHFLDIPNADGERCLHLAAKLNNTEMARVLIDNGADANLPDRRSGRTSLHIAADIGNEDITKFLISLENIDINQLSYYGETALEIAHMRERPEIVALLKPRSFPMRTKKTKTECS